jgi:hypothetical protein
MLSERLGTGVMQDFRDEVDLATHCHHRLETGAAMNVEMMPLQLTWQYM